MSLFKGPRSCGASVRDGKANVGMIFALSVPVLALGVGIAVDFTNASVTRNRLNAAADAAALSALTPTMMAQTDTVAAQHAAQSMFNGRVQSLTTLMPNSTTASVRDQPFPPAIRASASSPSATPLRVNALFGGVLGFFKRAAVGQRHQHRRHFDRPGRRPAQHQFLPAARQFALDGAARKQRRHPEHDRLHAFPGQRQRLRLRLPSGEHQQFRHPGQSLLRRQQPTVASGSLSKQYCAAKNSKNQAITRSTILRWPGNTTSRCASTVSPQRSRP